MDSPEDIGAALLFLTRFLPVWLSYLLLSGLFLSAWLDPSWIGWGGMPALKYLVVLEVLGVAALAYLLSARDEFLGWIHIVPATGVLCIILWHLTSSLVALILPIHLLIRSVTLWRDRRKTHEVFAELGLSLAVMGVAWLAVGLVPFPHFGWSPSATPRALWWHVITWGGWKWIPQALPTWGWLYFLATSLMHFFNVRWPGMTELVERWDS